LGVTHLGACLPAGIEGTSRLLPEYLGSHVT
jgi:hypothetical protein